MVERKGDGKNLLISQRRFLLRDRNHYDSTKWELHLNYALSTSRNFDNTRPSFVMSRVQESIQLELQEEVDWAIFNVQQTGIDEDSGRSSESLTFRKHSFQVSIESIMMRTLGRILLLLL